MKPPAARPRPVVVAGDAVVEQQSSGAHLRLQEAEVRRVVVHADVLGQTDRGHRVETGLSHVAVVAVTDLAEIGQALLDDRLLRPLRLLLGQGDADRLHAVAGRVADHAAPATTHVEQPIAGLQPQLLEHQPVLVLLRLLERGVGVRIARAGVGHRRAEHPLVERVGDVVVVVDRISVAGLTVPQTFCNAPPPRKRLLRRRGDRLEVLEAD